MAVLNAGHASDRTTVIARDSVERCSHACLRRDRLGSGGPGRWEGKRRGRSCSHRWDVGFRWYLRFGRGRNRRKRRNGWERSRRHRRRCGGWSRGHGRGRWCGHRRHWGNRWWRRLQLGQGPVQESVAHLRQGTRPDPRWFRLLRPVRSFRFLQGGERLRGLSVEHLLRALRIAAGANGSRISLSRQERRALFGSSLQLLWSVLSELLSEVSLREHQRRGVSRVEWR